MKPKEDFDLFEFVRNRLSVAIAAEADYWFMREEEDLKMKNTYRIDEAADYLGVSRRTIERAIKDGELHSYKFRDARRIEAEELEKVKKKELTAATK